MASDMMAAQHNCEGLLKFILPDDTVTVDMEAITLTEDRIKIVVRKVLFLGARRIHPLQHFGKVLEKPKQRSQKNFWNHFGPRFENKF